jgi:hypothetical protein
MSSRADHDSARLRRIRRLAIRHGLSVLHNSKTGGYMITEEESRKPLLGGPPRPYGATLEAAEAYIDAIAAGEPE